MDKAKKKAAATKAAQERRAAAKKKNLVAAKLEVEVAVITVAGKTATTAEAKTSEQQVTAELKVVAMCHPHLHPRCFEVDVACQLSMTLLHCRSMQEVQGDEDEAVSSLP